MAEVEGKADAVGGIVLERGLNMVKEVVQIDCLITTLSANQGPEHS